MLIRVKNVVVALHCFPHMASYKTQRTRRAFLDLDHLVSRSSRSWSPCAFGCLLQVQAPPKASPLSAIRVECSCHLIVCILRSIPHTSVQDHSFLFLIALQFLVGSAGCLGSSNLWMSPWRPRPGATRCRGRAPLNPTCNAYVGFQRRVGIVCVGLACFVGSMVGILQATHLLLRA